MVKHPRLAFAAHCLKRWTIDLVADVWRYMGRPAQTKRDYLILALAWVAAILIILITI